MKIISRVMAMVLGMGAVVFTAPSFSEGQAQLSSMADGTPLVFLPLVSGDPASMGAVSFPIEHGCRPLFSFALIRPDQGEMDIAGSLTPVSFKIGDGEPFAAPGMISQHTELTDDGGAVKGIQLLADFPAEKMGTLVKSQGVTVHFPALAQTLTFGMAGAPPLLVQAVMECDRQLPRPVN